MSGYRPAFLLASLAATVPGAVFADTTVPTVPNQSIGATPEWLSGSSFGSLAIVFAMVLLLGATVLVLSGRITWRLGAIAFVGGFALLGGDAIIDGAWTAIAVSP